MSEATLNDFMLGAYEMIDDPELEDSWSLDKNLRRYRTPRRAIKDRGCQI
jgi:hypothetical protein